MTDRTDFRLSDAYETDLPEIVDYRILEYNRAYFAEKEAKERGTVQSRKPGEAKRRKEASRPDITASEQTKRSSRTSKSPQSSSSPRSQAIFDCTDDSPSPLPTAPPSEDAEEESSAVRYSISELVATIGSQEEVSKLPPELQRRVLDFRLAQQKRQEKYGRQKKLGT
jgi:hypothetical protein